MYGDIEGSGLPAWMTMPNAMGLLHSVLVIATFIVVMLIWYEVSAPRFSSSFENLPDYGIGQRRDVVAAIPAYNEESLQQRVDAAAAKNKSGLTGTRDIPVFFQDYDVEAVRKGRGAVSSAREGFEGGKSDDDLSKALGGH